MSAGGSPIRRTAHRTCPLCEATCGLAIEVEGARVVRVRGDDADPFSRGFLCPKGAALGELHHDPDRLRAPLVRRDGALVPATWDEAFAEVERGLGNVVAEHGRQALAVLLGNPVTHHLAPAFYLRSLIRAAGTRNLFTASTVDQMPQHVVSGLLWGDPSVFPLPDVDRTDYLLMLGANPMASNGSLLTAPDFPGRLRESIVISNRRAGRGVIAFTIVPRARKATKRRAAADLPFYWVFLEGGWLPRGPGQRISGGRWKKARVRAELSHTRVQVPFIEPAFKSSQGAVVAAFNAGVERRLADLQSVK